MATKHEATTNTGAYGWLDEIDPGKAGTGDRPILPEGEALFVVEKAERVRKEFGKFGTINVIVMHMQVTSLVDEAARTVTLQENIGLHLDLAWKVLEFFASIGQRDPDSAEPFRPRWDEVENTTGRCMLTVRKFKRKTDKDGEQTGLCNYVKTFLPPHKDEGSSLKF